MKKGKLKMELPSVVSQIDFRGINTFGAFSYGNMGVLIYNSDIGRYCSIGHDVLIGPSEHPIDQLSSHCFIFNDKGTFGYSPEFNEIVVEFPITQDKNRTILGNDVWVGAKSFIKRGVQIGDGAIIGANSTVVKDVAPYTVVAGSPARMIKKRFPDKTINALVKLKWWNYKLDNKIIDIKSFAHIDDLIFEINNKINSDLLKKFEPTVVNYLDGIQISI